MVENTNLSHFSKTKRQHKTLLKPLHDVVATRKIMTQLQFSGAKPPKRITFLCLSLYHHIGNYQNYEPSCNFI